MGVWFFWEEPKEQKKKEEIGIFKLIKRKIKNIIWWLNDNISFKKNNKLYK